MKHLGVPVEYTNSIGMKFVLIPPAKFTADEHTVGLYRFEDGAGSTLTDSSGRSRQGKLVNAQWKPVP